MSLEQFDAAIRIGAATILLLLGWLLFRHRRAIGLPALLFLPLSFCLAGFLVGNSPTASFRLSGLPGTLASFASGFSVIFLWWFCLSCFDSRFRLKGGVLAVGLAWALIAGLDRGLFGPAAADMEWSYVLVAAGFGIVAHLIWRLVAERKEDLIQRRHDARIMVAILLGGLLLIDLTADLLFGFAWRPMAFAMAQNLAILGFGLWLATRVLGARPEVITFGKAPAAGPLATPGFDPERSITDDPLRRKLSRLIEEERVFLDPDITFADFVRRMEAPERVVRILVNHELGFDHFRTFLNHYRMGEARRLLADPSRQGEKLIAIALDSGFTSLASFNRVFRNIEGITPSDFRETARRSRAHRQAEQAKSGPMPGFEERSAMF